MASKNQLDVFCIVLLWPEINSCASLDENISTNVLGFLSSNTLWAYHLDPKATNCIRIGRVSLPFSVNLHLTIIGDFFSSMHSINPSFSNSFKRIERTLAVSPGIDSKILLNRSIFKAPMSLSMSIVHFFPKTPKLALMGHSLNITCGYNMPSRWDLESLEHNCWSWFSILKTMCSILFYLVYLLNLHPKQSNERSEWKL